MDANPSASTSSQKSQAISVIPAGSGPLSKWASFREMARCAKPLCLLAHSPEDWRALKNCLALQAPQPSEQTIAPTETLLLDLILTPVASEPTTPKTLVKPIASSAKLTPGFASKAKRPETTDPAPPNSPSIRPPAFAIREADPTPAEPVEPAPVTQKPVFPPLQKVPSPNPATLPDSFRKILSNERKPTIAFPSKKASQETNEPAYQEIAKEPSVAETPVVPRPLKPFQAPLKPNRPLTSADLKDTTAIKLTPFSVQGTPIIRKIGTKEEKQRVLEKLQALEEILESQTDPATQADAPVTQATAPSPSHPPKAAPKKETEVPIAARIGSAPTASAKPAGPPVDKKPTFPFATKEELPVPPVAKEKAVFPFAKPNDLSEKPKDKAPALPNTADKAPFPFVERESPPATVEKASFPFAKAPVSLTSRKEATSPLTFKQSSPSSPKAEKSSTPNGVFPQVKAVSMTSENVAASRASKSPFSKVIEKPATPKAHERNFPFASIPKGSESAKTKTPPSPSPPPSKIGDTTPAVENITNNKAEVLSFSLVEDGRKRVAPSMAIQQVHPTTAPWLAGSPVAKPKSRTLSMLIKWMLILSFTAFCGVYMRDVYEWLSEPLIKDPTPISEMENSPTNAKAEELSDESSVSTPAEKKDSKNDEEESLSEP